MLVVAFALLAAMLFAVVVGGAWYAPRKLFMGSVLVVETLVREEVLPAAFLCIGCESGSESSVRCRGD